jgi:leucyl-tRNA synthetase
MVCMYPCPSLLADRTVGSIDGKIRGKLDIAPGQMSDEIWEYIFVDGPWPANAPLPK